MIKRLVCIGLTTILLSLPALAQSPAPSAQSCVTDYRVIEKILVQAEDAQGAGWWRDEANQLTRNAREAKVLAASDAAIDQAANAGVNDILSGKVTPDTYVARTDACKQAFPFGEVGEVTLVTRRESWRPAPGPASLDRLCGVVYYGYGANYSLMGAMAGAFDNTVGRVRLTRPGDTLLERAWVSFETSGDVPKGGRIPELPKPVWDWAKGFETDLALSKLNLEHWESEMAACDARYGYETLSMKSLYDARDIGSAPRPAAKPAPKVAAPVASAPVQMRLYQVDAPSCVAAFYAGAVISREDGNQGAVTALLRYGDTLIDSAKAAGGLPGSYSQTRAEADGNGVAAGLKSRMVSADRLGNWITQCATEYPEGVYQ